MLLARVVIVMKYYY